jgi:hypothetical protein
MKKAIVIRIFKWIYLYMQVAVIVCIITLVVKEKFVDRKKTSEAKILSTLLKDATHEKCYNLDSVTVIKSNDLKPNFYKIFPKKIDINSLRFKLEGVNYPVEYSPLNDTLIFNQLGFVFVPRINMFPTQYIVMIEYKEKGSSTIKRFEKKFLLMYYDDSLQGPKFNSLWNASDSGVSAIKYKGLSIKPYKEQNLSQLIFLEKFPNDVVLQFSFKPLALDDFSQINLQIFFGSTYSFFIGDGDDKTVRLWERKPSISEPKETKRLKKNNTKYCFRMEKRRDILSLYQITDADTFLVLEYKEPLFKPTIHEKFKTIGLAVWQKSKGVQVEDILIYEPTLWKK